MFYVISGGLKLQISTLLLSPVSKFGHPNETFTFVQQVVSVRHSKL